MFSTDIVCALQIQRILMRILRRIMLQFQKNGIGCGLLWEGCSWPGIKTGTYEKYFHDPGKGRRLGLFARYPLCK